MFPYPSLNFFDIDLNFLTMIHLQHFRAVWHKWNNKRVPAISITVSYKEILTLYLLWMIWSEMLLSSNDHCAGSFMPAYFQWSFWSTIFSWSFPVSILYLLYCLSWECELIFLSDVNCKLSLQSCFAVHQFLLWISIMINISICCNQIIIVFSPDFVLFE